MDISYIEPVSRAFSRMRAILFYPFKLSHWFALGFTAWLAVLGETYSSFNFQLPFEQQNPGSVSSGCDQLGDIQAIIGVAFLLLLGLIIIVALVVGVAILWLNSRGRFIFLDNVVRNRSAILNPWRTFQAQANSLFLWRLVFGVLAFGLLLTPVVAGILFAVPSIAQHRLLLPSVAGLAGSGLLLIIVIIPLIYIDVFLREFVVPIMYRNNLKTTQAWQVFIPLLKRYFWGFLLYGPLLLLYSQRCA